MSQLQRDYARLWLGPLRRAIRLDGLKFEKGVVVACRLSGERAAEFTGHPLWRTVRSVDVRNLQWNVSLPRVRDFFAAPVMSGLSELRGVSVPLLTALMERRMPWRLRELEVLGYGALEPGFLDWLPAFRALERCTVNGLRWRKRDGVWAAAG